MGSLIPFENSRLRISTSPGGLRNTIDLKLIKGSLDSLIEIKVGFTKIPVMTFAVIALLALVLWAFFRTKLGQEFRRSARIGMLRE